MEKRLRLGVIGGLLALSAWVTAAVTGWACVPQPVISVEPRSSGPPGTEVTIRGVAVAGKVEIRWNAVDGERLATADGPSFSVPVRIPQAEQGLYGIIVLSRAAGGSVTSSGGAAFLVTGPEGPVASETTTSPVTTTAKPTPAATPDRGGWKFPWPWGLAFLAAGGVVGGLLGWRLSPRGGGGSDGDAASHPA